jgi:hypothetical protein
VALIAVLLAAASAAQQAPADFVYSTIEEPAMVFRTVRLSDPGRAVTEYRQPMGQLDEPEARILVEGDFWTRYIGFAGDRHLYETVYRFGGAMWSFKDAYDTAQGEEPATFAAITDTGRELFCLSLPYPVQDNPLRSRFWNWDEQAWQNRKIADLPIEITETGRHYVNDDRAMHFEKFLSDRCVVIGFYSIWQNTPFLEKSRSLIYQGGSRVGFISNGRIFVKEGDNIWNIRAPKDAFAVYDLDVKGTNLLCSFLFTPRIERHFSQPSDWDSPLMYPGRIYQYSLKDGKQVERKLFDGYGCRFLGKN